MKKIIYVIVGMIVMGGVVFAAEILTSADSISYNDSTTVAEALDDLLGKANSTAEDMLVGKTAYVNGELITGTMPNNEAWTGSDIVDGKIMIPAGYHNGEGYIDMDEVRQNMVWSPIDFTISKVYTYQSSTSKQYSELIDFSKISFIKGNFTLNAGCEYDSSYASAYMYITDESKKNLVSDSLITSDAYGRVGTMNKKNLYLEPNYDGKGYIYIVLSGTGCTSANGYFYAQSTLNSLSMLPK